MKGDAQSILNSSATLKPKRTVLRELADLTIVGIMFPVCIALGYYIGSYLDMWLGTKPYLTLAFILLGIAAAFVNLFRTISRKG